jgi:DNA-binding transcriptional ArsR family regulator
MNTSRDVSELLKAIAHPERVRLLLALRAGPECVCHLTALLKQRQPYVSQQMAYLREAGLVGDYKEGTRVYYHIRDPRVFALLDTVGAMVGVPEIVVPSPASRDTVADCPCPRCATALERRVHYAH